LLAELALARRVLIPVQFFTQGVVVAPPFRMQEGNRVRRTADEDAVLLHQAGKGLHVEIDADIAPAHDFHDDLAGVGQDDGPVRQRMRGDRHEHDAAQGRMQQGAAGRQRVSGRARGRGNNQAIRALVVHEVAIDLDAKFGHAGAGAARDDDIVDGHAHVNRLTIAQHAAFKQGAALSLEAAAKNLRQHGQHAFERDVGHETQSSLIDADQRYVKWRQLARNAQHGAVAAHDDGAIGGGADLGRRHGAHAGKRQEVIQGRNFACG